MRSRAKVGECCNGTEMKSRRLSRSGSRRRVCDIRLYYPAKQVVRFRGLQTQGSWLVVRVMRRS